MNWNPWVYIVVTAFAALVSVLTAFSALSERDRN